MKVNLQFGIKTYSGTVDGMTFGSYKKDTICIGRKHVSPRITENNTNMGAKMKNLSLVYGSVTSGYKDDLKTYAIANAANVPKGKLPPTSFAIFVKMMFLFSELDSGHIDLATVSITDLQTLGEDIACISAAVENGYLQNAPGADLLTATL